MKTSNAPNAPNEVRKMRTEDAAVGMQLVNNDVSQICKKTRPIGMMRKNSSV